MDELSGDPRGTLLDALDAFDRAGDEGHVLRRVVVLFETGDVVDEDVVGYGLRAGGFQSGLELDGWIALVQRRLDA